MTQSKSIEHAQEFRKKLLKSIPLQTKVNRIHFVIQLGFNIYLTQKPFIPQISLLNKYPIHLLIISYPSFLLQKSKIRFISCWRGIVYQSQIISMIKPVLLLLIFAVLVSSLSTCQPFGLRIYYGDVLINTNSTDRLAVYFNTQQPCKDSFVNIISSNGFRRVTCQNIQAITSTFYSAYIHQCSFADIPFEQSFSYIAFGWAADQQPYSTPHKFGWTDVMLTDPTLKQAEVKVIAFADWGVIKTSSMTPIIDDLRRIITNQRIDGVVIAGDIAYDLDTDNGSIYEGFLLYIEEFTSKVPFILAPGNHQRKTADSALLFNRTFKTYGVDTKLASGLSLGSLFFLPFDPFNPIYGKPQTISSLQALKTQLQRGSSSGRFIIPFSHYPLICASQQQQCFNQFATLHDYLDAMIDAGTSLFLGAHTHSYERNYPYFKDHTFLSMEGPYEASAGYLVSVVEGVAGNQISIAESMPQKMDYTAKYTVGETGFGVIKASKSQVSYSHFSTDRGYMDSILFTRKVTGKVPSLMQKLRNIRINDD